MSQLKAGDLALVVSVNRIPQNLGKCVELVRFVKAGEMAIDGYAVDDSWIISGDNLGYIRDDTLVIGNFGISRPHRLMPLRGQFTPETERETELVK